MRICCLLVLFAIIHVPKLLAQDSGKIRDSLLKEKASLNENYLKLYKENSELSYTSPGGEIGAPSKYVINGKLSTNYMVLGTAKLPDAFSVIPEFTVRVRNERSAGVRTPSFRLGVCSM